MLITFLKRACAYLEGKGIIYIKSAPPEISWSSTLISGHVLFGSTIIMGSALKLIPGKILGGLPLSTYAARGGRGGSSLLYIFIAYYMQKGGEGVQIACKIAYVLNGRPLGLITNVLPLPQLVSYIY